MQSRRIPIRKFVAPEIVFGEGARGLAGQYAADLGGSKVLLVTDKGLGGTPWPEEVRHALDDAGIEHCTFDEVSQNPRSAEVRQGVRVYQQKGCDIIVAVGGGSPIDCAKAIGASAINGMEAMQFEGVDAIPSPGPPLICIPTTSGSSADVSQFSIITDEAGQRKFAIISKFMVPDMSLLDPVVATTMPSKLTAATGMDALVHGLEAYVSTAASPMTDLYALEAIAMCGEWLPRAVAHGDDVEVRGKMMMASMFAGLAFSNASLGLVHAMAHSLGGRMDAVHGECNALLLEHVVRFNYQPAKERYDRIFEKLRPWVRSDNNDLSGLIHDFRSHLGMDETLSDIGVKASDIPQLAQNAAKDPCMATNPRPASVQEIGDIYERAL